MARRNHRQQGLRAFELVVVIPTIALIAISLWRDPSVLDPQLLLWVLVVAAVELAPVPSWRGVQISMGFPLLIAVAFLYPPVAAAATALVGSFDPREIKGEVGPLRALFNRCQVSLAVLAASLVFHSMTSLTGQLWLVLLAAVIAATVDYLVNFGLVAIGVSILHSISPFQALRKIRIGDPAEFLISYLGLGALGVVLAQLYLKVGFWAVAVFIVPLIFARQMFYRSRALEDAHAELKDREAILRRLSNRMAEERQDERSQIAAYLHDDLAQLLFRLSLQVDIASRYLEQNNIDEVRKSLSEVRETKNRTSERIRALVRDLHRSPLGRAGLGEAIKSFWNEVGRASEIDFKLKVSDLSLPPPIQLLIYQIVREAIMNALKYAEATKIEVRLSQGPDDVELKIQDNGEGFDAEAGEPEGHFGLTMMKERAQVAGGTFDLVSATAHGTAIVVRFPLEWLQAVGSAASSNENFASQPRLSDADLPTSAVEDEVSDSPAESLPSASPTAPPF